MCVWYRPTGLFGFQMAKKLAWPKDVVRTILLPGYEDHTAFNKVKNVPCRSKAHQ